MDPSLPHPVRAINTDPLLVLMQPRPELNVQLRREVLFVTRCGIRSHALRLVDGAHRGHGGRRHAPAEGGRAGGGGDGSHVRSVSDEGPVANVRRSQSTPLFGATLAPMLGSKSSRNMINNTPRRSAAGGGGKQSLYNTTGGEYEAPTEEAIRNRGNDDLEGGAGRNWRTRSQSDTSSIGDNLFMKALLNPIWGSGAPSMWEQVDVDLNWGDRQEKEKEEWDAGAPRHRNREERGRGRRHSEEKSGGGGDGGAGQGGRRGESKEETKQGVEGGALAGAAGLGGAAAHSGEDYRGHDDGTWCCCRCWTKSSWEEAIDVTSPRMSGRSGRSGRSRCSGRGGAGAGWSRWARWVWWKDRDGRRGWW